MKYTPDRVDKIVECLEKGLSISGTCDMVGIGRTTYYQWIEEKPEFKDKVNTATAVAELLAVELMLTTPRTARDWLERQRRQEYAPPGQKILLAPAEGSGLQIVMGTDTNTDDPSDERE